MKYYLCATPFFPGPDNWRGSYVLDQVKAIARNSNYKVVVLATHTLYEKARDNVRDNTQFSLAVRF